MRGRGPIRMDRAVVVELIAIVLVLAATYVVATMRATSSGPAPEEETPRGRLSSPLGRTQATPPGVPPGAQVEIEDYR